MPLYEFMCIECGKSKDILMNPDKVPETGSVVVGSTYGTCDADDCDCEKFRRVPSMQARMSQWSNW
jgi:hypothetical protein